MKRAKTVLSETYPVQALREHATQMEAAVLNCMAEATPHAVHRLRTESRRIEALLELLGRMKGLPSYRAGAAKLTKQLRKVRKAAGVVRDLDVQQRLIEAHPAERSEADRKDREALLAVREKRRRRAALELQDVLAERRKKISRRLEKLMVKLEPAEDVRVPAEELLRIAERQFAGTHGLIMRNPSAMHLHGIRKAAKIARYQTELAGTANAKKLAKKYKSLQEAGGHWHDWMELAEQAADELGKKRPSAAHFREQYERRFGDYWKLLEQEREDALQHPMM